jgi:hypothetical protein
MEILECYNFGLDVVFMSGAAAKNNVKNLNQNQTENPSITVSHMRQYSKRDPKTVCRSYNEEFSN